MRAHGPELRGSRPLATRTKESRCVCCTRRWENRPTQRIGPRRSQMQRNRRICNGGARIFARRAAHGVQHL